MTRLFSLLAACAVLAACQEAAPVGVELLDDESRGVLSTDTLTIAAQTVLFDSVSTQGVLLAGAYDDPALGRVLARAYVPLALGEPFEIDGVDDDEVSLDSLTLAVYVDRSYGLGDRPQTLSVHRVTEGIEPDDDEDPLFYTDAFAFDPVPLGQVTLTPDDDEPDLEIRLDDALGQALLDAALDDDEVVTDADAFEAFLSGLVLLGDGASAVVGFRGGDDGSTPRLRLYYQADGDLTREFTTTSRAFSNLAASRPAALSGLTGYGDAVASDETGDLTFAQAGFGLMTRLDVPALYRVFYEDPVYAFHAAFLTVRVPEDAYNDDTAPLPERLALFVTDEDNDGFVQLITREGGVVTARPRRDDEFGGDVTYRFDISLFVLDAVARGYDAGLGLLVAPADLAGSLDRVVLGGTDASRYEPSVQVVYSAF